MGSTRRSFTDEYRQQAVEFVLDQGRSIAEVARNIGCHEMTLGKWVKKERDARELQRLDADEALTELVCTRFGGQWFRLRCLVRLFDRALNILGLSRPVSSSESWSVAVSCCSSRTRRAIERSVRRAQATAACG